jgi:hypothetical protein
VAAVAEVAKTSDAIGWRRNSGEFRYFFTFFGLQRSFFFAETAPHSLQRNSPGFGLRFGFPK